MVESTPANLKTTRKKARVSKYGQTEANTQAYGRTTFNMAKENISNQIILYKKAFGKVVN